MIERISIAIIEYLLKKQVISEDEKEYYRYGVEITISSILNVILILLIGVIFKSITESLVFLILFVPLRQFTGGYHADTYLMCNTLFCGLYLLVLLLYKSTYLLVTTYMSVLITFISVSIFIIMCPIEHINKPIAPANKKRHKITAALLGTVYGAAGTMLTALSNKYGVIVLYTLLLVCVLVVAAKCRKGGVMYEED